MIGIEKFNNQLNDRKHFLDTICRDYYSQIEVLLKSAFLSTKKQNSILVIGAGRLKEVPLETLLKQFNKAILTDVDIDSIHKGIDEQKLDSNLRKKIDTRRIEYTGFEVNHFFDGFYQKMMSLKTEAKIEKELRKRLDNVSNYKFLKDEKDIDFIYVSPIYTQLVYTQVLLECEQLTKSNYPDNLIQYIKSFMLDEMINVINRFNNNILDKLSDTGVLFVVSDILQVTNQSNLYKTIKSNINNFAAMEEIYHDYVVTHGMGLGDYGLYNLDNTANSELSDWLIWPYDSSSSFVVKLKIYSK